MPCPLHEPDSVPLRRSSGKSGTTALLLAETLGNVLVAHRLILRIDLCSVSTQKVFSLAAPVEVRLEPCAVRGDADLLAEALHNLFDNAEVHGEGDILVSLSCEADDMVRLSVENGGPLVSPEDATQIFEPFRQLRAQRTVSAKGQGLGLSIVHAIARGLEHLHLGWAMLGWAVRLPGVAWFLQLLVDASGGGPRDVAQSADPQAPRCTTGAEVTRGRSAAGTPPARPGPAPP